MEHETIEYQMWGNETPVLVLHRLSNTETTAPCPFCGNEHQHGTNDGHRVAHCPTDSKDVILAKDGTALKRQDGYIIKSDF